MSKKIFSLLLSFIIIFTSLLSLDMTAFSAFSTTQTSVSSVDTDKSLSIYDEFNLKTAKGSFIIPGLENTVSYNIESKHYSCSEKMVPQGICTLGAYTLITAYDSDGTNRSVIYVLNQTKKLIKTLILPDCAHVGGIAYDTKNKLILISKGTKKCVSAVSFNDFSKYMRTKPAYVKIKYTVAASESKSLPGGASGVTYHNGLVHIFYFSSGNESKDFCYEPEYDAKKATYTLKLKYKMSLPDYTQAMTIVNYKGKTRLFVTSSYGRCENKYYYFSYLYTYTFNEKTGEKELDNVLACPPMLEQTTYHNNKLYCLFESAASLYRGVNKNPVDTVIPLSMSKLCDEKSGAVINIKTKNSIGGKTVTIESNKKNVKIYYSSSLPYIHYGSVANGYLYNKPYLKTSSSRLYAVAVYNGKIIAADTMNITIGKAAMPTGLKVKSTTKNSVTLKWSKVKDADGYYIYRSENPNDGYEIYGEVKGNKVTYKDTGLKSNKKYYYKIISYKYGCRTSDKTNYVSAKTKKA
ncbi:MAG: fibronectin type III domain-containing protein [Eubacterium sp.]